MALSTKDAIIRFDENEDRINKFVNELGTYVPNSGLPNVETLPSFMQRNSAALNLLASTNVRGSWASSTAYSVWDEVQYSGTWYRCVVAHTSTGTFDSSKWRISQGVRLGDLLAASGSSLVGYGSDTVEDVLDSIKVQDYAALRAYNGTKSVSITGKGIEGEFKYDSTDTTTADDYGTVIVTSSGKRFKRQYSGMVKSSWFGTTGNLADNQTVAFQRAIAACPIGSAVEVNGFVKVTSGISINKRIGLFCATASDAIIVDVGTAANGITFDNGVNGINDIVLRLNVYGGTNCANIALVLNRIDRCPDIELNVFAGCISYAVAMNGCLINNVKLNSSANFTPPTASGTFGFQRHHLYLSKIYGVSTNANDIWVNLEGGGVGIYSDPNMTGEANNHYHGTIEGLSTDNPLYISGAQSPSLTNLHLEANSYPSYFINCANVSIKSIINPNFNQRFIFQNSSGISLENYFGEYEFDDLCTFVDVGLTKSSTTSKKPQKGYYNCLESRGKSSNIFGVNSTSGDEGTFTLENLFSNPFMDIWNNGGNSAPHGWYMNNATAEKAGYPSPVYTNNAAEGYSLKLTMTGATFGAGVPFAVLNSQYRQFSQNNYLSAFIPVYVPSGQPDVAVYGFSGVSLSFYLIGVVTEKDKWVDIRGSWICPANTPNTGAGVAIVPYDSTTSTPLSSGNGQCYIGGLNIVLGTKCPKHLADHGKRKEVIAPNITYAPSFVGQTAFVSATGKVYFAKGTSSTSDWVVLN